MDDWDYIVIGAGSAGSVVANRLSKDPGIRVLLLEEGPSDDSWQLRMPKGIGKALQRQDYVTRYQTTHIDDGVAETWTRGRTLGGSSSVNGMVWMRGQPDDYDDWVALGNPGWSWAEMAPYFKRLEDHQLGESETRGVGGPIAIRPHPNPTRLAEAFIASVESLGVPRKDDLNVTDQEGVGYLMHSIDRRGVRSSAARGFLRPQRDRANLKIMTGVRIDRILVEHGRATGVSGLHHGNPVAFHCAGEVILSAGAIISPKLLQLSGIGPADLLQAHGIPVLIDNPGVGGNMREHRLMHMRYRLRHKRDSQNHAYRSWGLALSLARYALFRTGPLALGAFDAAAFVRSLPHLKRPDGQIMFAPWARASRGKAMLHKDASMDAFAYLLRPESSGHIRIAGGDPALPPRITPNYLSTENDRTHAIALVRYLRRVMDHRALRSLVESETERTAWAQSDEEILEALRTLGQSGAHACGTCAMGQQPGSVVDERLRVRGIERLRVVDLSFFPTMVSGNTNAPVMATAWRASDLIREDRRALSLPIG